MPEVFKHENFHLGFSFIYSTNIYRKANYMSNTVLGTEDPSVNKKGTYLGIYILDRRRGGQ